MKKKKISSRRQYVRQYASSERFARFTQFVNSSRPVSLLILLLFIASAATLLSIDTSDGLFINLWKPYQQIIAITTMVVIVCLGAAFYIHHYQPKVIQKPTRALALAALLMLLLIVTGLSSFYPEYHELTYLATGSAVTCAIILTIAYDQRFAMGITLFYCVLARFAAGVDSTMELFLTMMAGVVTCCFSLKEIRTRMKLIQVTTLAAVVVFAVSAALGIIQNRPAVRVLPVSGSAAIVTLAVGLVIQGFLPVIEKMFGIATSMTLMDYSDANQPLLRKLAMDAPGTFSHSLLIGSVAEAAAESIGANGLLARVGAYYHDIGKTNKPGYFAENQMGSISRHSQLSPAMSQLVIVGHVKDGIKIAREFGLPTILRQFIETHHGTTLIEYFYNEAKKQLLERQSPISETEFRYPGPKPPTKEAAIVMLADTIEGAVRSLPEISPTRIETVVHNMAMKRLQDGQFDQCDLTLRELSKIEASIAKSLTAHHHGRLAYPKSPDEPAEENCQAAAIKKNIRNGE